MSQFDSEYANPAALQERLATVTRQIKRKEVVVGVSIGDGCAIAAVGDTPDFPNRGPGLPMRTGCISKLFTAALVRRAVAEGRLGLDNHIADGPVDWGDAGSTVLRNVTVRHLLEHTHGIDGSAIMSLPLLDSGRVDSRSLCDRLIAVREIASPGSIYNYSNVGAWFLSAILEHCYDRRHDEVLRERLFAPLSIAFDGAAAGGVACPAVDDHLTISVSDVMRFLRDQMDGEHREACGAWLDTPPSVLLPGWNPIEQGVNLGWTYYGSGWYGHNSTLAGASAMVRVQTKLNAAIMILSKYHPAMTIAAKLFGGGLPEFAGIRTPKHLTAEAAESLPFARYVGEYGNAALRISVTRTGAGLQLQLFHADLTFAAALLPAEHNVFYLEPQMRALFSFAQFLPVGEGAARYLWNGHSVWRAIPSARLE